MAPAEDTQSGTTAFMNESVTTNSEVTSLFTTSSYIGDNTTHSRQAILSRYHFVSTVPLAVSETSFDVKDFFNNEVVYRNYYGSMGVRGTMKFKLTWNSDPMVQGLYLLTYLPPNASICPLVSYLTRQVFFSGCPHVLINLSKESSAELIIPYEGETPFIPLYGGYTYDYQIGVLHVIPLIGAKSTTSPLNLNGRLYFAFDDVETFGTMSADPVVQSISAAASVAEAIKKSKIVSKTANNISDWLNSSVGDSSIGRAASWAVGGAGRIADLLGWSKPMDVKTIQPVVNLGYKDIVSCDSTFTGVRMAQNSDAEIAVLSNDKDEMTFSNLFSRYEYLTTFNVTKASTPGTELKTVTIAPNTFYQEEGSIPVRSYNKIGYMSTIFKKWRGSLKFKLVPVATRFHSTRIRVAVSVAGTSAQVFNRMAFTYSAIVDVDDPSTWEFVVPYIGQAPWRDTAFSREARASIYFYLENALIAPDNVVDNVDFVLFVKGGDDLEFAQVRTTSEYLPWTSNYVLPGNKQQEIPVVQSHDEGPTHDMFKFQSTSAEAHSAAVGDPIRSLRSVLKRFFFSFRLKDHDKMISIATPFLLTTAEHRTEKPDLISRLAPLFVFYRGGFRYFMNNYYPVRATLVDSNMPHGPYNNCSATVVSSIEDYETNPVQVPTSVGEPLKVEVPYYQLTPQTNMWTTARSIQLDDSWDNEARVQLGVYFDMYMSSYNSHVLRAVADDFSMSYSIGAPACIKVT